MCRIKSNTFMDEPPLVRTNAENPEICSTKTKQKNYNTIWAGVVVCLIFITTTIIVVALGQHVQLQQDEANKLIQRYIIQTEINNKNMTDKTKIRIITREKWSSLPFNSAIPKLEHPIKYIIICHTVGRFCENFENCSFVLKWMQNRSVNILKDHDVPYNFLIGGDGYIYEARGWNHQNKIKNNSITIAFIGNYVLYDHLTDKMINTTKEFFNFGVDNQFIDKNYLLVPQNQTMNTMSPGENIYKEIKNWHHFSSQLLM